MAIQIDRAIFLHIPKTGGTWVRNYFRETRMDHMVEELHENQRAHINGVALNNIIGHTEDLKFCFVRHPLTWYRSYWTSKQLIPDRTGGYLDTIVDLPWIDFLQHILKNHPGYLTGFFEGYTNICRFIGKQENLREDLYCVLSHLKIRYNKEYIFRRVLDNVVPSDKKYPKELALTIMKTEENLTRKYDYNYIPLEVIE